MKTFAHKTNHPRADSSKSANTKKRSVDSSLSGANRSLGNVKYHPFLQPKLTINRPDDKYEQEADRIADAVMRMPDPTIQRKPT